MKRILVVDDSIPILWTAEVAIKSLGHEAVSVTSAADGLAVLQEGGIDLAILDYDMPGMDGVEMLCRMRTEKDETPVVFSSSLMPDTVRNIAISFGVRDYLDKNFKSERTKQVIERVLAEHKVTGFSAWSTPQYCDARHVRKACLSSVVLLWRGDDGKANTCGG